MPDLIATIQRLKQEKKAIILAHNYQTRDILEIADYLGDSFELAQKAQESEAEIIVFAGVRFMAESAKLLNPRKKVLLPHSDALCPMAGMVDLEQLAELKAQYPAAKVVCYINTTAATKALCDYCVTSANAVQICAQIPSEEIIFLPDQHLANYVQEQLPQKKIISLQGYCHVHTSAQHELFKSSKAQYPEAELLLHPETPREFWQYAEQILGTGGMMKYVAESPKNTFLIATEEDMASRLSLVFPDKKFIPLLGICPAMKQITLQNIAESLAREQYEVEISQDIFERAKLPLERMMQM